MAAAHPLATVGRTVAAEVSRTARWELRRRSEIRKEDPSLAEIPEFDPFDDSVVEDPWAAFRNLHAGPRVHRLRRRGMWILHRHEDVRAAARSHEALCSGHGVTAFETPLPMLLTMDRPDHARLRPVLAREFTARASAKWAPSIRDAVDEALAPLLEGEGDFIRQVASPVPVAVIASMLGVPSADVPSFRRWSDAIVGGFNVQGRIAPLTYLRVAAGIRSLHRYFSPAFVQRREAPGHDLISLLVSTTEEGKLSDEELFWFTFLLLVAGNETTTNLLGAMVLALAERPEQYEVLRGDPSLAGAAVEEALRWTSPIQGFFRSATAGYAVGEATIPDGARVLLLFGAANRDPRVFDDPDEFDISRAPSNHVAFGSGIHFCLGAHLARLEATIALQSLLERVERIELTGEPRWLHNPTLRGVARLPVRLIPA